MALAVSRLNTATSVSFFADEQVEEPTLEAISEEKSAKSTDLRKADPHPIFDNSDMLLRILLNLSGRQIAILSRVNRFFYEKIRTLRPLRDEVNFAKYKIIDADERYFSRPEGDQYGRLWKILTHRDIFRLAERLQTRGNHKTDLRRVLDKDFIYPPLRYFNWEYCRPTDLIKLIPDKEVSSVYYYLWEIIGAPQRVNAGKDAFYDINGMRSTSAQKIAALIAFLREKSKSAAPDAERQHDWSLKKIS